MIEISIENTKQILTFMSRVTLQGSEAPLFTSLVTGLSDKIQAEEGATDGNSTNDS